MKRNIFEGFRRIQYLLQGLWVLVCVTYAWNANTYLPVTYLKSFVNATATILEDGSTCEEPDKSAYISGASYTAYGVDVHATLCFKAMEFNSGHFLIPFKNEDGKTYGDTAYSDDVQNYVKKEEALFAIPENDYKLLDKRIIKFRWEAIKEVLPSAFLGCIAILAICSIIGWVVRGFMGIPQGKDSRHDNEED